MRTGSGILLLLGLVIGVAVGWVARDLKTPAAGSGDELGLMDRPDWDAEDEVGLRGRAGSLAAAGAGAEVGRGSSTRTAGGESAGSTGFDPTVGGFEALVGLCAVTGRDEEFHRLADIGIRNGLGAEQILAAVNALARTRRAAILDALLARHPDLAFDELALAQAYCAAGATARALEIVKSRLPTEVDFSHELVALLVELDPRGAAPLLFALPSSRAWSGEHLSQLRARLVRAGHGPEVLPFLTRRLEDDATDNLALGELIEVDPSLALDYVEARLLESPEDAGAWSMKARIRLGQGDKAAAFDAYREAARHEPSAEYLNEMIGIDLERAMPILLELTKDTLDDEAMGALAKAYDKSGEKGKAMEVFLRALKQDPTDDEWLGFLIGMDPQRALAAMKESLGNTSLEEANDEVLGNYADALLAAGEKQAAFDHYLAAFERDKGDSEWMNSMAGADPARALEVLKKHLLSNPRDDSAHAAVGKALAGLGRREAAIVALERAIRLNGTETYFARLGELDPHLAVKRLQEALIVHTESDELWGALGKLHRQLGREADARAAYSRAAAIDPDDADWRKALGQDR